MENLKNLEKHSWELFLVQMPERKVEIDPVSLIKTMDHHQSIGKYLNNTFDEALQLFATEQGVATDDIIVEKVFGKDNWVYLSLTNGNTHKQETYLLIKIKKEEIKPLNLRILFGRYLNIEKLEENTPLKVKLVLECIKDSKYFSDPLKHACDDHTLVLMDNDLCIGTAFYTTSFYDEVNYQIDIHPDLANNVGENMVFAYYRRVIALMENMFKTMGYTEAKVWLTEDDIFTDIYKEVGYSLLDGDTNRFNEDVFLFSHIL